ncbi:MAG TPA: AAA family ATPase [Verrucomicrobiota bacterium]|nr:AAA family ATPase [Verrucomicrobiota bacterium]HNU49397.1 AAA family ATPase [Verrucomicrobiota bacterium]
MPTSSLPAWKVGRSLDLHALLTAKSHFLFGPRQTGKSFLIRCTLPSVRLYDLLDTATFLALSQRPHRLAEELQPADRTVVIDEIQRLPELLNEVHRLIEARDIRFLLTGSSARRLRRGGVNLLGGRARTRHLHPLTSHELGERFDLIRALRVGLLPSIYVSDDPRSDLEAYCGAYLQEEIRAESATRNIPAFSRFLRVAALCNASVVNFTNIASDAQVPRTTVYEYFDILRDTLIVHELPAWRQSVKRKPIVSSKYYFFDPGVVASLQGRRVTPGTPEFGELFETWLHHELASHRDYTTNEPLAYWRSTSGFEVDFLLGDHTAVEAKAKETVGGQDLRGLRALAEEDRVRRLICVSLEPRRRRVGKVEVWPYREFVEALWAGEFRA